jgi:molybdopterin molybdotransferase
MITIEKALQLLSSSVSPIGVEKTPLTQSLNCILAENVASDTDMPPFDKAAMDGFACRRVDLADEMIMVEVIPAGKVPMKRIEAGQCSRIMTGAMVPEGADVILMKENAVANGQNKVRCTRISENENICYKGEDIKSGEIILRSGTKLGPAHLALLAATGHTEIMVYQKPDIAVISTGDELVEPGQLPGPGKIRNSNGIQLAAQAREFGLTPSYLGIVDDNKEALLKVLAEAVEKYHVVLISGGVSVGDYDYIPEVLKQLTMEVVFHGLQVKPGKHLLFAEKNSHYVVGMPGNPVSSFVQFEIFVKPLLNQLMGYQVVPLALRIPIEKDYERKKQDSLLFVPVQITEAGTALPLEYHGSAHIHAYAVAQGIMEVPVGVSRIMKGELVHVRPLQQAY